MDIPALCGVLQGALSQEENQRKAAEALLQQVRGATHAGAVARRRAGRRPAAARRPRLRAQGRPPPRSLRPAVALPQPLPTE